MSTAYQQPTRVNSVNQLLQQYQADQFFFSSLQGAMLASDWRVQAQPTNQQSEATLQNLFNQAKSQHDNNAIVFAALPFDQHDRGIMYLPRHIQKAAHQSVKLDIVNSLPVINTMDTWPTAAVYQAQVRQIQQQIAKGKLTKAVLARTLCVYSQTNWPVTELLRRLWCANQQAYVFALPLLVNQKPAQFLGASPELMMQKVGAKISVHPLAGSMPRSQDLQIDQANAQSLLLSAKNHNEHAVVVDAIAEALAPLCQHLQVPKTPSLLATSRLWHLGTLISGQLKDSQQSSLSLAQILHPTPAVCGYPRAEAYTLIKELEPFDRHLFSGLVGYCYANGDGEWALALRCAQLQQNELMLYAGAGIVSESDPASEYAETAVKLTTFLSALGLSESQLEAFSTVHEAFDNE